MTMTLNGLLNVKIRHLYDLKTSLEGFNHYRTLETTNNIKCTAKMLSVDIIDLLDVIRWMPECNISDAEYQEIYSKVSETRQAIEKYKFSEV